MEHGQAQVVDNLRLLHQQGRVLGRRLLVLDLGKMLVLLLQGSVEEEDGKVGFAKHQVQATQVVLVEGAESGRDPVQGLLLHRQAQEFDGLTVVALEWK